MGRKLSVTEETALLRQVIREAHEALQGLRDAIRQADRLSGQMVTDFEAICNREIRQLSNYITEESNRHAASLNADVERARAMISEQIMAGQAVFDRHTSTVTIHWGAGAFDQNAPLPYPNTPSKETPK